MRVSPHSTIRQIALHVPGSSDLFEQEGIDFRRGADRTLDEACRDAEIPVDYVARRLERLSQRELPPTDWMREPLFALTSHIVNQHHEFARREMPRLVHHALELLREHGSTFPELARIDVLLRAMVREFQLHMMSEEQMIFPYIVQLESAADEDELAIVPPPVGENPLRNLMAEHDSASEMLRELRYLTADFTPPEDCGAALEHLYFALEMFEADLREHIRLEDEVLFPRALELESRNRPEVVASVDARNRE